jgi:hypothetical protein
LKIKNGGTLSILDGITLEVQDVTAAGKDAVVGENGTTAVNLNSNGAITFDVSSENNFYDTTPTLVTAPTGGTYTWNTDVDGTPGGPYNPASGNWALGPAGNCAPVSGIPCGNRPFTGGGRGFYRLVGGAIPRRAQSPTVGKEHGP